MFSKKPETPPLKAYTKKYEEKRMSFMDRIKERCKDETHEQTVRRNMAYIRPWLLSGETRNWSITTDGNDDWVLRRW